MDKIETGAPVGGRELGAEDRNHDTVRRRGARRLNLIFNVLMVWKSFGYALSGEDARSFAELLRIYRVSDVVRSSFCRESWVKWWTNNGARH